MSSLSLSPALIAAIVGGVFLLLIIRLATEDVVNIVSQPFQLVGRLVFGLASEFELAANALFSVVRDVFTPAKGKGTSSTAQAPKDKTPPSAAAAGSAQSPAAPTEQAPSDASSASESGFRFVAETVFIRLLYLATVVVVVGSDFVFAILRLQAVLFPSLPTPIHDLSLLSLLTGALFVSIVLLTGSLTLDFLNVLPEQARLFPALSKRMRYLLLSVSLLSFFLSIVVVGALFFEGQQLISFATSSPLATVVLATLIGVLQVMVVFLGAWGAVRGLAILLALLGGVVGIVFRLIALILRWIGDAFEVIGTSILPDLIRGIAAVFGYRDHRPPRTTTVPNMLSIVGYGDRASPFIALLTADVVNMYAKAGLLAVGAYADEPAVRDDVLGKLDKLGVYNISSMKRKDGAPLDTLRSQLVTAYRGKDATNKLLLWVVDGEQAARCAATLSGLKHDLPDLSIAVLCLLPPGGIRGQEPFTRLQQLASGKQDNRVPVIQTTILVDDRSPLYRIFGEPIADRLVARGLSGMLLAPQHNPANPSFVTVVRNLNEAGYAFAALATDSIGVAQGNAASGTAGSRRPSGSGSVSPEQALARTQEVAARLLSASDATTIAQPPSRGQQALYVNFVVPLAAKSDDFTQYKGRISNWLADTYQIYQYGVVDGEGVDVSEVMPSSKGERYTQVGVLYGINDAALTQQNAAVQAGRTDQG